ncbi:MAG: hypothetical protein P8K77_05515 [Polaribacter sp.]|nr:hypothetical protein [Polaribacter sp.]
MIQHLSRKELDVDKYNACITKSIQSRMYAYAWYLDIVADNWDVLVLNDYEAVMPIPWRKKYFFKYVYPPFWMIELGIFSRDKKNFETLFLKYMFKKFKFVELRMNTQNLVESFTSFGVEKQLQCLSLQENYDAVFLKYKRDRKKDLRKAEKANLIKKWGDDPENLIKLFSENVGKRTKNIKKKEYKILLEIMKSCIEKKVGEMLSVYTENNELIAAAFFLKHQKQITILVSSTDFKNRKNGANTFLIDSAIYKYQNDFESFHFGGSSIPSIAKYFKSFGAKTSSYFLVKKRLL